MADIKKLSGDKIKCLSAIAIIVGCYGVQRLVEVFSSPSTKTTLAMMFMFVFGLVAAVYLIANSKHALMGMLASLIGYKMMPPAMPGLQYVSVDGSMIYFVIQKFSVVLFIVLTIKMYRLQKEPAKVKALPVLACMCVVPFMLQTSVQLGDYLMYQIAPTMLYSYFSQFVFYIIATAVILLVAYQANYESMRFVAYFEFVAIGINILRKVGLISALLIQNEHVSKSYYVWIFIYVVCIIMTLFAKKSKGKKINA